MTDTLEQEVVKSAHVALYNAYKGMTDAAYGPAELDVYQTLTVLVGVAESLPSLLALLDNLQANSPDGTSDILSSFSRAEHAADEFRSQLGKLLSLVVQTRYGVQEGES